MTATAVRSLVVTLLVAPLLVFAAWARSPELAEAWNAPAITWRDIRSGIREATVTQRPVVMVFHAPWCGSCKKYREVFKDPAIVAASKNFVMILVDADADKMSNGAFAPDGTYVPRTIFMDWEGNIRTDIRGSTDPEHPQTIDIESPGELLALMLKAAATSPAPVPDTAPDNERRASSE